MNISKNKKKEASKYLSYILRHSPQTIGLNIDEHGWADIEELIQNTKKYKNRDLTFEMIQEIVETDDKKRYVLSDDGKRIRACQGHSINVDLQLTEKAPPLILYHGTARRFLDSIMKGGLKPQNRQYVHLSMTEEVALSVGKRHGQPVILQIKAYNMYEEGYRFYLSENNIWLTEFVPVKYLQCKE